MAATVEVAGGWETVLDGAARQQLERSVLPDYLRGQRWFGGKGRRVESVRLADRGDFPAGRGRAELLLLEVRFAEGPADLYFFPVGVAAGDAAARLLREREAWVVARLKGPQGEAVLHDALADDDTCRALVDAIGAGREVATRGGRVRGEATRAFAELRGDPGRPLEVKRGPPTSSNTLVFYGGKLMLKLFRRLEVGVNPDFEIGRFLTERTAFDRLPRVAGALDYHRPDSPPITLAILQSNVANDGDGWRHALDELGRYYPRAAASGPADVDERPLPELAAAEPPPAVREAVGTYLGAAATLGRRTAEMHLALASDRDDPDFAPRPFTAADVAALRDSIRSQAGGALAALRANIEKLPAEVAASARPLLDEGASAPEQLGEESAGRGGSAKIRCHGDYHLGQVLRVGDDFVILDFEGEPVRTVEERRARQSPLKDVAGMVRSYHYAAYAGLFAFARDRPDDFARLEPWAELWSQWVSAAFLREYRRGAAPAGILPEDPAAFAALLDAFTLDKAFYELNYELNNRPDWVRIPLRGILALVSNDVPSSRSRLGAGR